MTIPIVAAHVPRDLTGIDDVEAALRAMRQPHHRHVVVTRGEHGAAVLTGDQFVQMPGFSVAVTDTTGAGDVFRGAFICAWLRGAEPAEVLRFANAAAAVSCTRAGALESTPTLEETYDRLAPLFAEEG